MSNRIAVNALFCTAVFLAPVAAFHGPIFHPAPWFAAAAALVVLLSQPRLDVREAVAGNAVDRGSALGIFAAMTAAQAVAALDFARHATAAVGPWFVAGAAVALVGLTLRLWAIHTLGRFFTSTVRVVDDQVVVRTGPYRWLRHPSYTGALLAAFGTAIALGSVPGAALTLVLCVPAYLYRIAAEERALGAGLGDAYRRYREQTWGLVPGLR